MSYHRVMATEVQLDQITSLRFALGAGPHEDAPSPGELAPYGAGDELPEGALQSLTDRGPELSERVHRLGLSH